MEDMNGLLRPHGLLGEKEEKKKAPLKIYCGKNSLQAKGGASQIWLKEGGEGEKTFFCPPSLLASLRQRRNFLFYTDAIFFILLP